MIDNGIIKRHLVYLNEDLKDSWHERKRGVYHASSTGKCVRRNYFDWVHDVTPPASAYVHFELGHRLEEVYLDALKYEFGDRFVKTDMPICLEFDDFKIVGETDPVVFDNNGEISQITEVKTTTNLKYTRKEPKQTHLYQTHCYMKALDQDSVTIVYICKRDLDSVTHTIEFDSDIWDDIVDRTETLHNALENEDPPDPVGPEGQDHFCDHSDMCCKEVYDAEE